MSLVMSPRADVAIGHGPPKYITPPKPLWWADQREAVGYLLMPLAVWLFVTLWVLDYPQTAQAQDAHLNEILVGVVILFNGMYRLIRYPSLASDVVLGLAGVWLVAAPFAVGYTTSAEAGSAAIADWATGGVLVLLALYSACALKISERLYQRESRKA